MRLACDAMLGRLARYLRAAGHDTRLATGAESDDELRRRASAEDRWLLTRDRALADAARPQALLLPHGSLSQDAARVRQDLGIDWLEAPFTRCLVDNTPLAPSPAEQLAGLPPQTRALAGPFRACPACGRLYWPGSHVRRMSARLEAFAAQSRV